MGMIGGWELLLIFFIVLILFGAKRLPELAKSLGRSVQEFKQAKDDVINYSREETKERPAANKELSQTSEETGETK